MRINKVPLLVAVLAVAAVGCSTDDGQPTGTGAKPPLAYVRYINALPDTQNTTVRWIDYIEYTPQTFVNVAYRGIGQGLYQGLKAGSRQFRVFNADAVDFSNAGNTAVLAEVTQSFEAGKYYTILFTGYARAGSKSVKIVEDVLPSPGSNIAIRVLNANTGLGAVDAYKVATATTAISGSPTFSAVAGQAFSAYVTTAPGAFAIRATAAGDAANILASAAAPSGTAGTTSADPIGGATVAGSVITAMVFPASVAGSKAASSTSPSVVYVIDKQPPRTTSP
ncbi:MAG: DUF4397 domain-containing protein [Gemmatimonadaceae bacterium]|nr:DUF4397 domain-containing protein [Gemmatimonadaceae bacterium]